MILLALVAPFALDTAIPSPAADQRSALEAGRSTGSRCIFRHLPGPANKIGVAAVMRCTDRFPADARLSPQDKPAIDKPASAALSQSANS